MLWMAEMEPWSHLGALLLATFAVAFSALAAALGVAIWRNGLLALLRSEAPEVLRRPLFDVLHDTVRSVKKRIVSITRFCMLLFLTLDEEEQNAIRNGLGPELQEMVFRRPLEQLLPSPVRRFLFGPQDKAVAVADGFSQQPTPRDVRERPPLRPSRQAATVASYAELKVPALEAVIAEWTVGAFGTYAKLIAIGTYRQLQGAARRWRVIEAPKLQHTLEAAPILLGGSLISLGCGSIGMVGGGFVGAVCGLVPALLTFGLSIPVGAVIGGLVGWCCGLVSGILLAVLSFSNGKLGLAGAAAQCRHILSTAKCCVD